MISVHLILVTGAVKRVDISDDMSVRELISDFVNKFKLPRAGPDGFPFSYELHSKALGRKLSEDETMEIAGVPTFDRIKLLPATIPGCFPKSSRVLLPSGEFKEIGALESGDQVLAYYNENGGSYRVCEIEGIYRQTYSESLCFNSKLVTTPDQPILMSDRNWKIAGMIIEGDEILQFPYRKAKIESIQRNKEVLTMLSVTLPQPLCFVVENFIVRDFIGKQNKIPNKIDVFVSYSEMDKDKALKVFELLEKKGFSTFLAEKSIKPGQIWEEAIKESLKNCVNFLLLITPTSLASEWVVSEWSAAWALDKNIIPILFRCRPEDLPRRLQSHQCVDFHELETAIEALQKSS